MEQAASQERGRRMTEQKMRSIGDEIWVAEFRNQEHWEKCPDCIGKKFLTVILGDDSRVTIDCDACSRGCEVSTGHIRIEKKEPKARIVQITGISLEGDKIKYTTPGHYRLEPGDIFDTESEALAKAKEIAKTEGEEKRNRAFEKEYRKKSWAWNVSFHRRCIRQAEKDLAYHSGRLAVAKETTKKEKASKP